MRNRIYMPLRAFGVLLCTFAWLLATANSPYIHTVYSYRPAPGQFINVLSDPQLLVGSNGSTANMVCLGAWGGEVVFGFDHPVVNIADSMDFEVMGNYFNSSIIDGRQTGSSEPGIIWVARDENGNGIPDDVWYEIAGSEYNQETQNLSITYYRPTDSTSNVMGIDSNGDTLWVRHNAFHAQAYYPNWIQEDSYTLTGSLLPNNISGTTLYTLDYGYADNAVNGSRQNYIDIDWAVDAQGQPAGLAQIDFVRVQTGVNQDGGIMGESSTEVTGARDLHPDAVTALEDVRSAGMGAQKVIIDGQLFIRVGEHMYDTTGKNIY